VDLILTGNYLKESNTIRLSFQLVDIRTNEILWHEALQEEYDNTFRLQDTVARKVADGLRIQFSPDDLRQMRADVPKNPLAYDYFLRGISYPVTLEDNRRAISMFRQSIALDSTYAPAFNELGFRLQQVASYSPEDAQLAVEAESALLKALSLNEHLSAAYGNLSNLYTDIGKTEKAFEISRKLLKLNPNSPYTHFSLGYIYRYVGFLGRSEREMELALNLDPKNPRFRALAITYYYLEKYDKALRVLDIDSSSSFTLAWKGAIYFRMHRPELALPYLNEVIGVEHESIISQYCREIKAQIEQNHVLLKALIQQQYSSSTVDGESLYILADQTGMLGDPVLTAMVLRKAIEGGFFNYPLILRDRAFASFRGHPEFEREVSMAKEKYEAFKALYPELREGE
jgi:tetratricopeptide (TPR) repeat protein